MRPYRSSQGSLRTTSLERPGGGLLPTKTSVAWYYGCRTGHVKRYLGAKFHFFCFSPLSLLNENLLSDIRQKKVELPICKTAKARRMLPNDFPPWGIVHYYYSCFHREGICQRINDALREKVRLSASGTKNRQGFDSVVAQVCMGTIGAVAARELSRFTTNSREWQRLIEVCRVADTIPTKPVHDRYQIQPATVHTNVRDIRRPNLVRTRNRDVLEQIRIYFVLLVRHGTHLRSFPYPRPMIHGQKSVSKKCHSLVADSSYVQLVIHWSTHLWMNQDGAAIRHE